MRKPTPVKDHYAAWRRFVETGEEMTYVAGGSPLCGFFKTRRFRWAQFPNSKKNPFIPARIYPLPAETDEAGELLEDERLVAEVDGKSFNPYTNNAWLYWKPVTEEEWQWLKAMSPLTIQKIP